jgi:hypothetical protein
MPQTFRGVVRPTNMFLTAIIFAAALVKGPIPLDEAKRAFDDARLASEQDGGKLWGVPLYGPMFFVDPETRSVVANVADAAGTLEKSGELFTGTLDKSIPIANTAVDWKGTRWTMVMWNSISKRAVPRRRLMMHESFHRVQDSVGLPANNDSVAHLDTLDGRYWFRLELRALAAALRSDGDVRARAISDALAFRAKRLALFPETAKEPVLENNEGLAEYTGWALRGTADRETRSTFAQALTDIDPTTTFSRSFAYSTGPAYGLLLDILDAGWTRGYKSTSSLSALLAGKVSIVPPDPDGAAQRYGGAELRAEEIKREAETRAKVANYRALLIEGPILELPTGAFSFDPYTVTTIPDAGTVYGTFEVTAPWGTFKTESGALMTPDGRVFVPASARDSPQLHLATGWQILAGDRSGDFRVTR